ncbi:hypothetical protein CDAR_560491 [Caerostris darwini]|uniref:Uncharacterized protein n=1 Tax=Caerostris darwini TaxID=1538125 RepID=A0AAV4W1D6_9ARAC|nr:hypothetical protein CDAR_560231 [Caerostris darwini]GIY75694.1 hypothetical protein CDAR_560491 [Caerostris darwini]
MGFFKTIFFIRIASKNTRQLTSFHRNKTSIFPDPSEIINCRPELVYSEHELRVPARIGSASLHLFKMQFSFLKKIRKLQCLWSVISSAAVNLICKSECYSTALEHLALSADITRKESSDC